MTRILVIRIPHRQETRQLSGEKWTPREAKRGLVTLFFATPNDHGGDAVQKGAGDHG
jgi:hypothetical protein